MTILHKTNNYILCFPRSVIIGGVLFAVFHTLSCVVGLVLFGYYNRKGCDPISTGHINNMNQVCIINQDYCFFITLCMYVCVCMYVWVSMGVCVCVCVCANLHRTHNYVNDRNKMSMIEINGEGM